MPVTLLEALGVLAAVAVLAYPAAYWLFVRAPYRFLLAFASYGLPLLVVVLVWGLVLPFEVLAIYMVPQLDELGYLEYLKPALAAGEIITDYRSALAVPLYLLAPPLLHMTYGKRLSQ